jgi:hypothetical protein
MRTVVTKSEKKGGGKLNRTQTVTMRLDPRLRYLTDLAARTQRRTTSGFIEWAIELALSEIVLKDSEGPGYPPITLTDESNLLWDIDESDRFAKLAIYYPNLLTHDEQVLWKLISETTSLWTRICKSNGSPYIADGSMNYKMLREHWDILKTVAEGQADKGELPSKAPKKQTVVDDEDLIDVLAAEIIS